MRGVFLLCVLLIGCNSQKSEKPEKAPGNLASLNHPVAPPFLQVDTINTLSKTKLRLIADYAKKNYGLESYKLDTPRMIVVHYTAYGKLSAAINTFKPDFINKSLNVGIHYLVDKDGTIFNLMPDTIVARHVIGFNHVALGIENVANDSTDLTEAQVESNAKLIRFLSNKYPTIEYMIGHHEYNRDTLPHFRLFRALDKYEFSGKIDPGDTFMSKVRVGLANEGVVLKK